MIHKLYLKNTKEIFSINITVNEFNDIDESSISDNSNLMKFIDETFLFYDGKITMFLELENKTIYESEEYCLKKEANLTLTNNSINSHIYEFFVDYISKISEAKINIIQSNESIDVLSETIKIARRIKVNGEKKWKNLTQ